MAQKMVIPEKLAALYLQHESALDALEAFHEWLDEWDDERAALDGLDVPGLTMDRDVVMSGGDWENRIDPLRRVVSALGLRAAADYLDADGPQVLADLRRGQDGWGYDTTLVIEGRLRDTTESYAEIGRKVGLAWESVRAIDKTLGARK